MHVLCKSKGEEVCSRHVPERAAVDVVGGDDCRGRRSGVGVGEEAVAAERARGARADEPGVEAGAVEGVAAPELAHLGPVADGRQAEGALGVPRRARPPAVRREREQVAGLGRQRRLVLVAAGRRVVGVRRRGAREAVAEEGAARGRAEPATAPRERGHAEAHLAQHQEEDEAGQGEGGEQRAAHLHGCWTACAEAGRDVRGLGVDELCALLCSLLARYVEIRSAQSSWGRQAV
jgi:hypothetical protein